jgi:hypothetical protein
MTKSEQVFPHYPETRWGIGSIIVIVLMWLFLVAIVVGFIYGMIWEDSSKYSYKIGGANATAR